MTALAVNGVSTGWATGRPGDGSRALRNGLHGHLRALLSGVPRADGATAGASSVPPERSGGTVAPGPTSAPEAMRRGARGTNLVPSAGGPILAQSLTG